MPVKTLDEIKALIDRKSIGAITVDTSIFDKFGCNLEYKSLTALEQFKGSEVQFLLSPVIVGEVRSHIATKISQTAEKTRAGINQFLKATYSRADLQTLLESVGTHLDPIEKATEIFNLFAMRTGATIITEQVSSDELLGLYFGPKPPFENADNKKSEFPDAIALLSFEKWARENDTLVLAVSGDNGWQAFAENSAEIVCANELATALNLFHRDQSVFARRIANIIRHSESVQIASNIETELYSYLEDFEIEATSSYRYEEECGVVVINGWELAEDASFAVVEADGKQITLSFEVDLDVQFEANFRFFMRDGIDRDYVRLGSNWSYAVERFPVTVVATFSTHETSVPELIDVSIEGRGVSIDFGEVEPSR